MKEPCPGFRTSWRQLPIATTPNPLGIAKNHTKNYRKSNRIVRVLVPSHTCFDLHHFLGENVEILHVSWNVLRSVHLNHDKCFVSHSDDWCSLWCLQLIPGGKAAQAGVGVGDWVVSICEANAEEMTHVEAQNKIRAATDALTLTLSRYTNNCTCLRFRYY